MSIDPLTAGLDAGGKLASFAESVINRMWPDPQVQEQAKIKLAELAMNGDLQRLASDTGLAEAQIALNKIEAGSSSFWAYGWRPGVGWAGVSALFFSTTVPFGVQTMMWVWQCVSHGEMLPAPSLDTGAVIVLLGQILGVSTLAIGRTIEKKAGVAS